MWDFAALNLLPDPVPFHGGAFNPQPATLERQPCLPPLKFLPAAAFLAGPKHWLRLPSPAARLAFALIVVAIVAAFNPFIRPVPGKPGRPLAVLAKPLDQVRDSIRSRAALDLTEDFHKGLDSWTSRSNANKSWSHDSKGFVRPGALAVYRPTMGLKNYSFEIVTQLEQRALGAAYRLRDWDHYYALKLKLAKPNAMARIELVRYTVVGGRALQYVSRSLPVPAKNVSLHRIRLEAKDSEFSLFWDGKMVDEWSDGRYPDGGVGLFSGDGERARVLWLEVSKQHDLLGRFCALLTPEDHKAAIGSWSEK